MKVLSRVFRGKFVAGLRLLYRSGELCLPGALKPLNQETAFRSFLRSLYRQDWVVYAKAPFGGPAHVLQYLARYTHRVAISNHRLVNFADGKVTFRWKDYARGGKTRLMTLSAEEFLRRFLLHWLPRGFVRIRFFGFLANRRRGPLLPVCRRLLVANPRSRKFDCLATKPIGALDACPLCGGPMGVERLTAQDLLQELARQRSLVNSP